MHRFAAWLSIVSLFAVAVLAPIFEVSGGNWPGSRWSGAWNWSAFLKGEPLREIERDLDKNSALAKHARPYYNEALFVGLGHSPTRVVLGKNGRIFNAWETVDYPPPDGLKQLDFACQRVASAVRWFESQGSIVQLLVVPRRATVEPEHLPDDVRRLFRPVYPQIVERLRAVGLDIVDPLAELQASDQELFLRTDDHWDYPAALICTRLVAQRVRERWTAGPLPGVERVCELREMPPYEFKSENMVRQLGLRPDGAVARTLAQQRTPTLAFDAQAKRALMGVKTPQPIAVVGTSFSGVCPTASLFTGHFQREVENRALEGQAAGYRITDLFCEVARGDRPAPKILIWEFPEDFLISDVRTLTDPLEALDTFAKYARAPMRAAPIALAGSSAQGVRITAEDENGWSGVAGPNHEFVVDFAEAPPGDGTHWMRYTLTLDSNTVHAVRFESASGSVGNWHERTLVANAHAYPIFAPMRTADLQPVTRMRIRVSKRTNANFKLTRPELWRPAESKK